MIAALLTLLWSATPEENQARFDKAADAHMAKHAAQVQEYLDAYREKLKRLPKSDTEKAKGLREKIADFEKSLKYFTNPKSRPKVLYLNPPKLKAGDIGVFDVFDVEHDKHRLRVTVIRIVDKTTFIAHKRLSENEIFYYVEDYPTEKLEEGEPTLLRGMYEVTGLDTAPGPPMWHIKPFLLPERAPKK